MEGGTGIFQSHEMIPLMFEEAKFILSLDVGTTTVRSFLYNKQGKHIPFLFSMCDPYLLTEEDMRSILTLQLH